MSRMFCFWCEPGDVPKTLEDKGYVWIHLDCIMELSNQISNITSIKEILEGKKNEEIDAFLKRMNQFDNHTKKMLNYLTKKERESEE